MTINMTRKEKIKLLINEFDEADVTRKYHLIGEIGKYCIMQYDKSAFDFLLKVSKNTAFDLQLRTRAIMEFRKVVKKIERKTIITSAVKACIKLIEENLEDKEEHFILDFRKEIVLLASVLYKSSEALQEKLLQLTDPKIEKIVNIRSLVYSILLSSAPIKHLNLFLQAMTTEHHEIRRMINLGIQSRFGKNVYLWPKVKEHFTIDQIKKILATNPTDISEYFIGTVGTYADPDNELEKYYLTIIRNPIKELAIRKKAVETIGHFGSNDTIVELVAIKETSKVLRSSADTALTRLASRNTTTKENLVEMNVYSATRIKPWFSVLSIIFAFAGLGLNIIRVALYQSPNVQALNNLLISSLVFVGLTVVCLLYFIFNKGKIGWRLGQARKRYNK